MSIRFQSDADFNHIILRALLRREPAIEFQTAHAAGLVGMEDPEVLALAAREQRLLVTHDLRSMPHHFGDFILDAQSPGVLIVPQQLPIARATEDLLLIWLATDAEEWRNRIDFLPL